MRFTIEAIDFHEREVRLRMPFRFGVVTLTAAPQAFARVTIVLEDGRAAQGASAELLAPPDEQENFLKAHPDLYERSHGATRLKISKGMISMNSLDCTGFASRAMPDWQAMRRMQ